jgi:hypothetical protein
MAYSDLSSFTNLTDVSEISDDVKVKSDNNYEQIYKKVIINFENIEKIDNNISDKIKDFNDYLKNVNKTKKDIMKDLRKDLLLLDKIYKKNLAKIPKKRKNNNKGFNIVENIPKEIKEYCGDLIPIEITQASRPFVISALHKAFKRDGLKIGRDTILDKKSAKILKREEGCLIKFNEYQKFLAYYYHL